jgi:predicted porin
MRAVAPPAIHLKKETKMKMKRRLEALLVVAALSGEAAYAQSSVQLYGLVDAFVGEKRRSTASRQSWQATAA